MGNYSMLKSMDKKSWEKIEKIYDQAVLLGSEKHKEFVKHQAGDNIDVYHQVMKMLKTGTDDFMQSFLMKLRVCMGLKQLN